MLRSTTNMWPGTRDWTAWSSRSGTAFQSHASGTDGLRLVPLDPVGAVRGVLLLPDGHSLLQPVDPPLAGGDRLCPVRARNRDDDGRLADLQPASAMRHRHPRLGPLLRDLV